MGVQGVPNSVLLTKPFVPPQLVTAVSQLLTTGLPPKVRQMEYREKQHNVGQALRFAAMHHGPTPSPE
jgi:hypothetical protein